MFRNFYNLLIFFFCILFSTFHAKVVWNQTAGYIANVDFKTWSNFDTNGGCVTCPYTCAKPKLGPHGTALNFSNATMMNSLPSIYSAPKMNGCCYAPKGKSKQMPDCNNEAIPALAEDCGFLSGPSLTWNIQSPIPPKDALRGILFASIDCENFWAVGSTFIRQTNSKTSTKILGSKQIDGGCWGNPNGAAMVVVACITQQLKFDKSKNYRWDQLATKCMGIGGKCTRTNSLWSRNLKCCMNSAAIETDWDKGFKTYMKAGKSGYVLSGPACVGIVFVGVALLMCLVHYGAKIHQRAKQTALLREQEATDDYEEIITPLMNNGVPVKGGATIASSMVIPPSVELSLEGADEIYKKEQDEVLMEGDLY